MYIFIDESGSITNYFRKKEHRYFFITMVLTKDESFNINVKRSSTTTRALLDHVKCNGELKGSLLKEARKTPFYNKIMSYGNFEICLIKVDNTRLAKHMKDDPARTFNYLIKNAIVALKNKGIISIEDSLNFIIDNRNVKVESVNELQGYLIASLWDSNVTNPINVKYVDSKTVYGVQCADVISSTYRRYCLSRDLSDSCSTNINMNVLASIIKLYFVFPI